MHSTRQSVMGLAAPTSILTLILLPHSRPPTSPSSSNLPLTLLLQPHPHPPTSQPHRFKGGGISVACLTGICAIWRASSGAWPQDRHYHLESTTFPPPSWSNVRGGAHHVVQCARRGGHHRTSTATLNMHADQQADQVDLVLPAATPC